MKCQLSSCSRDTGFDTPLCPEHYQQADSMSESLIEALTDRAESLRRRERSVEVVALGLLALLAALSATAIIAIVVVIIRWVF